MMEDELVKEYNAWKNEKLRDVDARVSEARKEFSAADKALTKAFCAYDVDRHSKEKENAWILALNKRNSLGKKFSALIQKRDELFCEFHYQRFLQETGRE